MKVCFYANFRTLTNHAILDVSDVDIDTLRQLFEHLTALYPEIAPHLLDECGNLRQDVPIFVNGRNPRLSKSGLDFVLRPEDVISLFSPIASGRMSVEAIRGSMSSEEEQTP